jgi:hypothetical protein
LGLPTVLSPRSRSNVDVLAGSFSLIRAMCPAQVVKISDLNKNSSSSTIFNENLEY